MIYYRYLYNRFGVRKKNKGKLPSTSRITAEEYLEEEQDNQAAEDSARIAVAIQMGSETLEPLEDQDHPLLVSQGSSLLLVILNLTNFCYFTVCRYQDIIYVPLPKITLVMAKKVFCST